ncbi:carboxypeptidase Y-deficient [Coemansia interrupta]|uniref:Carboxypeptidase Y-deficient n=1 Tax=Coemansia interrupta TaxID=1126814 RepID=A0A9W8HL06_9FUNG|nr:carboxypeptidase Y-deficient [Coemansia interrupta]
MHDDTANSPASAATPPAGARHVRRGVRTLGPARHTRSQSATPVDSPAGPSAIGRRSTVSAGDALHCPICGVMAPSLAALNMHLDDGHFGSGAGGGSGEAGVGRKMTAAAQDDLEEVKGAILGFFRGAGRAVKGLGGGGGSDGGGSSPVTAAEDGSDDWWQGGRARQPGRPQKAAAAEGASRRHTAVFERLRASHLAGALLEGNRAEKRLEKLARAHAQYPAGPALQAAEKLIVSWQPDSAAQCSTCNRSLTRLLARRHHCRVCGMLVCGQPTCSSMLTLPLPLDGNHTAVQFSTDRTAEVRACSRCLGLVGRVQMRVRRMRALEQGPGELLGVYGEAREAMRVADRVLPVFNALVLQITRGSGVEPVLVARAARLRSQLTDAFGRVDVASRRIAAGPAESPGDARVRSAIRSAMVQYLQLHMFSLTMLPRKDTPSKKSKNNQGTVLPKRVEDMSVTGDTESQAGDTRSVGTPVSENLSVSSEPPGSSSTGLARSLLSYIVPRRVAETTAAAADDEDIRRALASDPEKELRIAGMALDEKLATLEVLRDQRQRVLGYIAEAQRDRRLEDAYTLQGSLRDLDVELSLIERNL